MAGSVGVFRTESGPEGVHFAQGQGTDFGLQLTRYRKVSWLFEEVFLEVHFAFFRPRWIADVQVGHPEHLAGAFCIAPRDDGGVHVEIAIIIVILMDGIGNTMTDAEYRTESIGAHAEVRFFAQELQGLCLRLHGIFLRIGSTQDFHRVCQQFYVLTCAL